MRDVEGSNSWQLRQVILNVFFCFTSAYSSVVSGRLSSSSQFGVESVGFDLGVFGVWGLGPCGFAMLLRPGL